MSQQALDLRGPVQTVRRHKVLVGVVTLLGLLLGGAYAVLNQSLLTSTALVVLPNGAPSMASQVVIAESDPVLSAAVPNISPPMPVTKLRSEVQIRSLTSYVISVSAKSKTAAAAEATANAVALSYVAYVTPKYSPVGHVLARILERATTTTGSARLTGLLIAALLGALSGVLVGIVVALAINRNDRRLRGRDDIANSIGISVLASVPVGHPSDAAGWTRLLEEYSPGAVDGWQLRTALQQLGIGGNTTHNGDIGGSFSLAVLSLSSDPGALALGPQLAVFAATHGISTAFVIGPQQDTNASAALRTACAVSQSASSKRPPLLRVTVSDGGDIDRQPDAALIIVAAVVDSQAQEIPAIMATTTTVIGVSAAVATAEQLARAAGLTAADGREISGILVADPEPDDRTNGRIPRPVEPSRRRPPARLDGIVTEIRRLVVQTGQG